MLNRILKKPQVQAICMCVIFTHCVLPCTLKRDLRGMTNDLALSLSLSLSLSPSPSHTHTRTNTCTHKHTHKHTHTHTHTHAGGPLAQPLRHLAFVQGTPFVVGSTGSTVAVWNLLTSSVQWSAPLRTCSLAADPHNPLFAVSVPIPGKSCGLSLHFLFLTFTP